MVSLFNLRLHIHRHIVTTSLALFWSLLVVGKRSERQQSSPKFVPLTVSKDWAQYGSGGCFAEGQPLILKGFFWFCCGPYRRSQKTLEKQDNTLSPRKRVLSFSRVCHRICHHPARVARQPAKVRSESAFVPAPIITSGRIGPIGARSAVSADARPQRNLANCEMRCPASVLASTACVVCPAPRSVIQRINVDADAPAPSDLASLCLCGLSGSLCSVTRVHMLWAFSSVSAPPCAFGVNWSTSVASLMRPFRLHGWHRWKSRASGLARSFSHKRPYAR